MAARIQAAEGILQRNHALRLIPVNARHGEQTGPRCSARDHDHRHAEVGTVREPRHDVAEHVPARPRQSRQLGRGMGTDDVAHAGTTTSSHGACDTHRTPWSVTTKFCSIWNRPPGVHVPGSSVRVMPALRTVSS